MLPENSPRVPKLYATTKVSFPNGLELHIDIAAQRVLGYEEEDAVDWLNRIGERHADKVQEPEKVFVLADHVEHVSQFDDDWWYSLPRETEDQVS
ncbi:hypothetical protein ACTOTM_11585 [Bacillus subtilis]|uniref:Uncharacterized protein n=1 Tax=Bacillus subtilis TaxID=1423 RepID=A0AC61YUQ7_BACIU|nr:hypothetical protein P5658_13195 [Bacillus subtilis]